MRERGRDRGREGGRERGIDGREGGRGGEGGMEGGRHIVVRLVNTVTHSEISSCLLSRGKGNWLAHGRQQTRPLGQR